MKKIFIYTENYQRGGGNQYLVDLINNVPLDCFLVIASNKGGIYKEDFEKIKRPYNYLEIPIRSLPILYSKFNRFSKNRVLLFCLKAITFLIKSLLFIFFKKSNFRNLSKVLEKVKPSLIISCNGGFPGGVSCLDCINVGKALNIPIWLTVVSMPQDKSFVDKLYAKTLISLDKLIVNSHNIASQFINKRNVLENKIFVLHNCLPNDVILKKPVKHILYDTELPEFKIGYVGRIEHAKGVFYLIDAFEKLHHEFPNLKLILVGSGTDIEEAKTQCTLKQIENKVEFTGYYAGEISEIMKTFNLFVFPSLWEGLPYSILEAMANGKVVISTNVGGIPEIITNGTDGFLLPPADSENLYLRIKEILENVYDLDRITLNSLNTILLRFSESFFQRNLQRLFNEINESQMSNDIII